MALKHAALAAAAVAAALTAGCGSSGGGGAGDTSASAAAETTSTAASAPAAASGAPVESATVDIKSFAYKPVTVVVKRGGRVRWTNSDGAAHTATADDRSFDTQTLDKGRARTVAMTSPGTFHYHCDFHPFMKATVIVK